MAVDGITVAWGLSISTLVTLVLIPTLYAALEARRIVRERKKLEKKLATRAAEKALAAKH